MNYKKVAVYVLVVILGFMISIFINRSFIEGSFLSKLKSDIEKNEYYCYGVEQGWLKKNKTCKGATAINIQSGVPVTDDSGNQVILDDEIGLKLPGIEDELMCCGPSENVKKLFKTKESTKYKQLKQESDIYKQQSKNSNITAENKAKINKKLADINTKINKLIDQYH